MLTQNITQILASGFNCARCHGGAGWVSMARPAQRQNSIIHRLRCAQCGDRIVAKVGREDAFCDGHAQGHLRREYETLGILQRQFPSDESYGTLEPLGYLESAGSAILITRLFDGDDLTHHMKVLDATGRAGAGRAAGVWLRRLHENGDAEVQMKDLGVTDRLTYLSERYGATLRGSSAMTVGHRCLEREGLRIGGLTFPAVRLHGDFKPENMLCDGTRYVGLDVQWRTMGSAVYDLAPFLNHLWLAGHCLGLRNEHQYDRVEAGFLTGYGTVDDVRVLRWAQLYFSLCQLGGYYRRGRLFAGYASWKVRPLVHKLVKELS